MVNVVVSEKNFEITQIVQAYWHTFLKSQRNYSMLNTQKQNKYSDLVR